MLLGTLSYKTKQFFVVLIKLSIVVGAFYFIYKKLTDNEYLDFNDFTQFLSENESFSAKNITFLIILSVFNWFFEIVKWKTLVDYIKKISFKNALEQTLGSLTASLITPNRIGEYGAKAAYYTKAFRNRIALLNLVGNMMQMTVTVLFGIAGLIFFKLNYNLDINYLKVSRFLFIILFVVVLSFFGAKHKTFKIKGNTLQKIIHFIVYLPKTVLVKGFLLSVIRYAIFSFQFYFLLTIFGVNVHYSNAMIVITSMYLLASIIPSIFIFDVVIKGSVAVYLFSIVGVNELTILCIVTLMWLLNFVIPSVFGSYYVLNFNLPKNITNT